MSGCDPEPLLHRVVLDDDLAEVRRLSCDPEALRTKNALGFTALEVAQLLGKETVVAILAPSSPKVFKVVPPRKKDVVKWSQKEFEAFFEISYFPHLRFSSYNSLKEVINNCPWVLRKSFLGEENREWGKVYRADGWTGYVADAVIKWIGGKLGYGLFADRDFEVEECVGEYTGVVRRFHRLKRDHNAYCFHYPTRFWSWKYFMIDALHAGNEMRFVNHSDDPNLRPICVVDRGLLHIIFLANKDISAETQLTLNYGKDYWRKRKKWNSQSTQR